MACAHCNLVPRLPPRTGNECTKSGSAFCAFISGGRREPGDETLAAEVDPVDATVYGFGACTRTKVHNVLGAKESGPNWTNRT